MKILLVNPKIYNRRAVPLGLAYIGAVLEENGHDVKVYDPAPYENITLEKTLRSFDPELVGVTCTTAQMPKGLDMAHIIKNFSKDVPIVLGGVHPTSAPQQTLEFEDVDIVVIGEGEETMRELADSLEKNKDIGEVKGIGYKEDNRIKFTEPRPLIKNLDDIPYPARDLFPMKWYTQRCTNLRGLWLSATNQMSSRGCPFTCAYCASAQVWRRKLRTISAGKVVDEMELLLEKYKIEGIGFSDDTFAVNKKRTIKICEEIRNRKLDLVWTVGLRVDTVDEEIIKELSKSGCVQISFGVESGSEKVLNALNKGTNPAQTVRAFKICKKYGIRRLATFMIGNPEETMEDIEKTRKLAHAIDADFAEFFITTPYPGTKLYEMAIQNKWISSEHGLTKYQHGGDLVDPFMEINFSAEELIELQKKLKSEFVSRKLRYYMLNPRFMLDMLMVSITKPLTIPKAILKFIKTMNLEYSLREFEIAQRTRRFP